MNILSARRLIIWDLILELKMGEIYLNFILNITMELSLTRDQILILFKQLYNKSNCFSRDWQSFLILFISFFFFFYFPCNLISRTKMKLQRNLARVSLFRTKHVRANSDRSKLCTVYRTELVNLFWWSLYLECTNDDFEAGFMDSSRGNSRMICDRLRISSVPYNLFECNKNSIRWKLINCV